MHSRLLPRPLILVTTLLSGLLCGPVSAQTPNPFPDLQAAVDAAQRDARGRTAHVITVVAGEAVTWRDSSLGCPEKDMAYGQALVPGFRIRLKAGAERFDYHASTKGDLVLCPPARARPPASAPS